MSDIIKELFGEFPLDLIMLVISAGLLFTCFFPFDIMSLDFTAGMQSPTSFEDISLLPGLIEQNYKPFVMLSYFADFPNGLIKILLLSFIPGLLIFFLQRQIEYVNHIMMRGWVKKKLDLPFTYLGKQGTENTAEGLKFSKWLKDNHLVKFIGFFWKVHYIPIGWLFALEILFGISLVSAIIASMGSSVSWSLIFWSLIFFLLLLGGYGVYIASERQTKLHYVNTYNAYKALKGRNLQSAETENLTAESSP